MMTLGPFVLESLLGRGGVGEVWRGYRTDPAGRGPDVAIKFAYPVEGMAQPGLGWLQAFTNEVRAVARLSHPSIIRVFDCGQVEAPLIGDDGHTIPVGAGFLVMELAHGSIEDQYGDEGATEALLTWPQALRVLLAMLDGLAHAHARGVIHRDIKPANILLFGPDQEAKLADFGIAYALSDHGQTGSVAGAGHSQGTPAYMAPEQFSGDWRECGPWTDLYALGCTAYTLLTGRPPFGDMRSQLECMAAHLSMAPPPLPPIEGMPDEVRGWLQILLAKSPKDRFQRAADAAWALLQCCDQSQAAHLSVKAPTEESEVYHPSASGDALATDAGGAVDTADEVDAAREMLLQTAPQATSPLLLLESQPTTEGRPARIGSTMPSLAVFGTLLEMAPFSPAPSKSSGSLDAIDAVEESAKTLQAEGLSPEVDDEDDDEPDTFLSKGASSGAGRELPPWSSWQRLETMEIVPLGSLGLYGLRDVPMVDRDVERHQLWEALHQVWERRTAACVVVRGSAGVGKSRLARWLCERAHELGLATPLSCAHSATPGHVEGLREMIGRQLLCLGLQGAPLREAIAHRCLHMGLDDPVLHSALAELIQPSSPEERRDQRHPVRLSSPQERFSVVFQYLESLCLHRPAILWFDDVQWGVDSLAFANALMQRQQEHPMPVLLVLSAQEEGLAERPISTQFVEQLDALPAASTLRIGPLPSAAWRTLIREQLGLTGTLADDVEARAAGNPMFAVQLIDDWLQRGLLEMGVDGTWRPRPGADAQIILPDSLFQVWERRISRLLSVWPQETRIALELAAALGTDIHNHEWEAVCQAAELSCPHSLVAEMVRSGLASTDTSADWTFSHHLFRESIERSARDAGRWAIHHALCADALLQGAHGVSDVRIGRHFLLAGKPGLALSHFFSHITYLQRHSEVQYAEATLRECQKAFDAADLSPDDRRRGVWCLLNCRACIQRTDYEASATWAQQALLDAELHGWPEIRYQALFELTRCSWKQGNVKETGEILQTAIEQAKELQNPRLIAEIHLETGHFRTSLGQLDAAAESLLEAQIAFVAIDDPLGQGKSYRHLGEIARQQGDLNQAAWYAAQAKQCFDAHGVREELAMALNLEGEISRYQGDLSQAERAYRDAIHILQETGSALVTIFEVNLGLTLLQQQAYDEALVLLRKCLAQYEAQEHVIYTAIVKLLLLPCLAVAQEWELWDQYLLDGHNALATIHFSDVDLAKMIQIAGDIAIKEGFVLRARRAFEAALHQWKALQREEEAHILESLLGDGQER